MTVFTLISLAVAVFLLAASPGPGVFAILARAVSTGFKPALLMIIGLVTGDIIYLACAVFGLSLVAQVMGELFIIVKLIGGAYLFWLGIKIWRSGEAEIKNATQEKKITCMGHYLSGLFITLSNPKVILFYCGFLPAFINLNLISAADFLLVTIVVSSVLMLVLSFYALLAVRAADWLSDHRISGTANRIAGSVMMATGIVIAVKK